MGWWKIKNTGGHIDPDARGTSGLVNALGGHDTPENHYNGDEPSDYLEDALQSILERLEHKPSRSQMAALFLRRETAGLRVNGELSTLLGLLGIVDRAWQEIDRAYQREWKRPPYQEEREGIVNFGLTHYEAVA